jgi:hypothetical protein
MIILMKKNATQEQIDHVTEWIDSVSCKPHLSRGVERIGMPFMDAGVPEGILRKTLEGMKP